MQQELYHQQTPLPTPKKRRRRWPWIVGIILTIVVIGCGNQSTSPSQTINYPPKTESDLRGLAAKGDASKVQEFHAESTGLASCPQPKRLITISASITGQQLAEDLLAYFYANHLDSACGAVLFAYHTQAEGNGDTGYTAGRVLLDVMDASGTSNGDPNATGLTYRITLDTGDVATGQEYSVNYTN